MKSLLYILLFSYVFCYSQDKKLDSLWKVYNDKTKADTNRIKALHNIAWSYRTNNPDTAILLAEQELLLAKQNKKFKANALNTIEVSLISKGNYPKAMEYLKEALKLFEEIGDKKGIGNSYINSGLINEFQSNYPDALQNYLKALKIHEEINYTKGILLCYNNIGNIYYDESDFPKALEYYEKDLNLCKKIGDKHGVATCYLNFGNVYTDLSDLPKALGYLLKSLKIYEELNDKIGIGNCYTNIGNIYFNQSEHQKALEYYFKELKIRKEIGDKQGIWICYDNIGGAYNKLSDFKRTILYSDSGFKIAKELGNFDGERLAYKNLAYAYAKIGNYKEAYENHVKFKTLTDSIFNADNSKQLGDMKTKFEVEKKEAELKSKADAQQAITAEEEKRQVLIIYAVAGVLLIVIIFSALLYKRFRLTNKQKQIIEIKNKETEEQKHLIEEKHREITDSINYAERIQRSFIATKEILDENLKNYFVLFKPKDVVSGDFYWASKLNNGNFALVTADSTGHGVPGAIMSLLNITSLEKAIEKYIQPADILNATRKTIIERLKKDGSAEGGKDGMDASITVYDFKNNKLIIAAANNPVWIVRGNETIEIKPDKMPVGKHDKDTVSFIQQEIDLQNGDVVYTLTDGFPDQFGGEKGKKFMSKNLRELLFANSHLPMNEQKQLLETTFKNWVGNLEQVDDVTIIGIRV